MIPRLLYPTLDASARMSLLFNRQTLEIIEAIGHSTIAFQTHILIWMMISFHIGILKLHKYLDAMRFSAEKTTSWSLVLTHKLY